MSATCEGNAAGPRGPIAVEYLAGDNDNLLFTQARMRYSAWAPIIAVGGFTRVGGANRVIEWVKGDDGVVQAIIFRVESDTTHASKLIVLGVVPAGICHLGTADTNEEARSLAVSSTCRSFLEFEQR